jgi:hypothetical protein
MNTTTIAETKNQGGGGMWPSPERAVLLYNVANVALILSLVAGVIATVVIVWMGNIKEEYLRRDLAQANAIAAQASLELAKLKAPRFLTDEQEASLVREMSAFKGHHVSVGAIPDTFEGIRLMQQIVIALNAAGIPAEINQGAAHVQIGAAHGVVAVFVRGNKEGEKFATAFANSMNKFGVKAAAEGVLLEDTMLKGEQNDPQIRSSVYATWVIIVVGDKA